MIYFLSEDSPKSPFIRLFNRAYNGNPLNGVDGNTALVEYARVAAKDGDNVVVYLDMVPKNMRLLELYDSLLRLAVIEELNVAVFPVVCSEYLFVRSLEGLNGPIRFKLGLEDLLSKSVDFVTSELAVKHNFDKSKTFEKFCKLFCSTCLSSCCSITSSADKISKKRYFSGDCACDWCDVRLSLLEKSVNFSNQFVVIPCGRLSGNSTDLTWEDVVQLSRDSVDEYNTWQSLFDPHARKLQKQ